MGGAWGDQDFGAGGAVVVQAAGTLLPPARTEFSSAANMAALGRTNPPISAAERARQNYAKLKSPPIFYTYYPGPQLSAAPPKPSRAECAVGRVHSPSARRPGGLAEHHRRDDALLRRGERQPASLALNADGASTYLACSAEVASRAVAGAARAACRGG